MSTLRFSIFFILALFASACVTINVYFPAAAAEKAADRIIQNVWGPEQQGPITKDLKPCKPGSDDIWCPKQPLENEEELKPTTPDPISQFLIPLPTTSSSYQSLSWLVDFLIPTVHAEPNLKISTPSIQALEARMAKRYQKLKRGYNNGAIALTHHGLITLRNPKKVPLKSRSKVKRLIADENKDRLALYREIAKANGHPEWEANIRKTFSEHWIKRALFGWWYQDKKGQWQRKR